MNCYQQGGTVSSSMRLVRYCLPVAMSQCLSCVKGTCACDFGNESDSELALEVMLYAKLDDTSTGPVGNFGSSAATRVL